MKFVGLIETMAAALTAIILSAVLFWGGPAKANPIDLTAWTCKQFQSAAKDEITLILAWLDGYYRAEDDPPVIDTDQLAANAKKLGSYCAAHPDAKLITAADTLFERE
jgi:acid stress chaperone HdeB